MTHTHTHTHTHTCARTPLHCTLCSVPKQVHNFAPRENSVWLKTACCDASWQQRYPLESFTGRTDGNTDARTSKLTMASGLLVLLFQTTQHDIQENCDLHLRMKSFVPSHTNYNEFCWFCTVVLYLQACFSAH